MRVTPAHCIPAGRAWLLRAPACLLAAGMLLSLVLVQTTAARACALDGIASLSANGVTANLTKGQPTSATMAYWAPFTLLAASPNTTLHLSEDLAKVRQSLPESLLKAPFRWTFGDGTTAYGHTVSHRYARPGWYLITVSYDLTARHRWVVFDKAEQQIVPPGDLWKTNFGYYLGNAIQMALRVGIWGIALVVIGAFVWDRLVRTKALPPRKEG